MSSWVFRVVFKMGGQRRSELVEQERSYKLVTKEKKESGKLVKQTLRFLFSQVGLIVLGIFTATLGEFLNKELGLFKSFGSMYRKKWNKNEYLPYYSEIRGLYLMKWSSEMLWQNFGILNTCHRP